MAQIQIMMVDPLNDPTLKAMKAQITKDQKNNSPGEAKPAAVTGSGAKPAEAPKVEPLPLHAWPAFRGPGGNGVAGHAKAPLTWNGTAGKEENIAWKVAIPKAGTNSPIAWGDRVF